jgi:hypothetical protein
LLITAQLTGVDSIRKTLRPNPFSINKTASCWRDADDINNYTTAVKNRLTGGATTKPVKKSFKCSYENVNSLYNALVPEPIVSQHNTLIANITTCAGEQRKQTKNIDKIEQ